MAVAVVEPEGLAQILIGFTWALGIITTIVVGARVWFRYWVRISGIEANAWGWDDWLAGLGLVRLESPATSTMRRLFANLGECDIIVGIHCSLLFYYCSGLLWPW